MNTRALFSLEGSNALVTGAGRGLGKAIAIALADAGANVGCVSSKVGGAEETASLIRLCGRKAWEFAADLSNRNAVIRLADEAGKHMETIDILVNNAGTIRREKATDYPEDDWDTVIRTNLDSVFSVADHRAEDDATKKGKIINIASLLAFSGGITVPAYTASKHGVAGLTKALANEWAQFGIQVNAIAPGYFETDNTEALRNDPKRAEEILSRIPSGRWGHPEDLAGAVIFLASRASDYVTGHVLVVDGGWMAR